jgi:hypothetical protein
LGFKATAGKIPKNDEELPEKELVALGFQLSVWIVLAIVFAATVIAGFGFLLLYFKRNRKGRQDQYRLENVVKTVLPNSNSKSALRQHIESESSLSPQPQQGMKLEASESPDLALANRFAGVYSIRQESSLSMEASSALPQHKSSKTLLGSDDAGSARKKERGKLHGSLQQSRAALNTTGDNDGQHALGDFDLGTLSPTMPLSSPPLPPPETAVFRRKYVQIREGFCTPRGCLEIILYLISWLKSLFLHSDSLPRLFICLGFFTERNSTLRDNGCNGCRWSSTT